MRIGEFGRVVDTEPPELLGREVMLSIETATLVVLLLLALPLVDEPPVVLPETVASPDLAVWLLVVVIDTELLFVTVVCELECTDTPLSGPAVLTPSANTGVAVPIIKAGITPNASKILINRCLISYLPSLMAEF